MLFDSLFEKIKENNDLFEKYESMGKLRNYSIKLNKHGSDKILGAQLTKYCTNKCSWCCSDCKEKGEHLNIDFLDELLKNTDNLAVTGGEALLHPDFKKLILKYKRLNPDKNSNTNFLGLGIMTSGINPDSATYLINRYYDNLEALFLESNYTHEGTRLMVDINFSFSDGVKPKERLNNFIKKYAEYRQSKDILDIPRLFFKVVTVYDSDKKIGELKQVYYEYFKPYNLERFSVFNVLSSGREKGDFISSKRKCKLKQDIEIRANGNLAICCAAESEMRGGLIAYANIYEHSLNEINERKIIYLGLLDEFQSKNNNSCRACASKNGLNDFLKSKSKEL